jgi:predicted SAM-dependent methyltransferase
MKAIECSAEKLPFEDRSFSAVISSDMLEHIPPSERAKAVNECLRVCNAIAIFGFPCGALAWKIDRDLHRRYMEGGETPPVWLEEHMEHEFPTAAIFETISGWSITEVLNENLKFHSTLMRLERHRSFDKLYRTSLKSFPWLLRLILNSSNRTPAYRSIFVLKRLAKPEPESP